MIILSCELYREILLHIRSFPGLSVECLHHLLERYPQFSPRTLWSILSWEHKERIKDNLSEIEKNSKDLLQEYEQRVNKDPSSGTAILVMAAERRYSPFYLSRTLIQEKFKTSGRQTNILIHNPVRIEDKTLRKNVKQCLEMDNLEGPVPDAYRDAIGVFFEKMLFHMLRQARIDFHTEKDLRRMGFRKTPDIRLLSECFYQGQRIHWIESKALFASRFNHDEIFHRQLLPYLHDFGPGIVIYWMGFVEDILADNGEFIHIRYDFPGPHELLVAP